MPRIKHEAFLTISLRKPGSSKEQTYQILSKSDKNVADLDIYLFRYLWTMSVLPSYLKLNTHLRLEMKRCHGVGLHNIGYIAVGSVMSDQRAKIVL